MCSMSTFQQVEHQQLTGLKLEVQLLVQSVERGMYLYDLMPYHCVRVESQARSTAR